jgi:hypothetical protein
MRFPEIRCRHYPVLFAGLLDAGPWALAGIAVLQVSACRVHPASATTQAPASAQPASPEAGADPPRRRGFRGRSAFRITELGLVHGNSYRFKAPHFLP